MHKLIRSFALLLTFILATQGGATAGPTDQPAPSYLVRIYFDKLDWRSADPDVSAQVSPERFFSESSSAQTPSAAEAESLDKWCVNTHGMSGVLHLDGRGKYTLDYAYFSISTCGGVLIGNNGSTEPIDLGQPISYGVCGGIIRPITIVVTQLEGPSH